MSTASVPINRGFSMPTSIGTKSLISISKAAKILGLSSDTLRNWEASGKLIPERTLGGARRYRLSQLIEYKKELGPKTSKSVISISRAAATLNVSTDTLRNWDRKGLLEVQRTSGGARRFARSEISRLASELGVASKPIIEDVIKMQPNFSRIKRRILIELSFFGLVALVLVGLNLYLLPINLQTALATQKQDFEKQIYNLAGNIESLQSNFYNLEARQKSSEVAVLGVSYDNSQVDDLAKKVAVLSQKVNQPTPNPTILPSASPSTVIITETRVLARTLSGRGEINEGSNSAQIQIDQINEESKVLVTLTSETDLVLAVTKKTVGEGFTVSASKLASPSAQFDWWMVNEVQ